MRHFFGEISWEKKAVVFFVSLAVLTLLGPFGTYETLELAERFVYWTALMIGIGFFMHIAITTSLITPYFARLPQLVRIIIGSVIAGLPGAAIVLFVNQVFWPISISIPRIGSIWMQVALVGIVIGTVEYAQWGGPKTDTPDAKLTPFHKRLSETLGFDIISMSMQDHYVDVTTTVGHEMILIRLTDAIAEIGKFPGARIHRSHWVAQAHLKGISRDGARHLAHLSDGRSLPVSNTYLKAVQAMIAVRQK